LASSSGKSVKELEAEAAAWAAKLDAAPDEGLAGLDDWLAGDPRAAGALLRAQAILAAFSPAIELPVVPDEEPQAGLRNTSWKRWAVGGIGLACIASLAMIFLRPVPTETYETGIGEVRSIALRDGSSVAIDANSRIDVDFDASARDIHLRAGKVLFRATHNAQRPFRVLLDGVVVTDIGTAFQVTRDDKAKTVEVLVTEGAVRVDSATRTVHLTAGQRGRFSWMGGDGRGPELDHVTPADIDRTLAWRDGQLELDGETLESAVAEVNRHSQVQIKLASPAIGREKLYGSFRMDDASGFARSVAAGLGTEVRSGPDGILIGAAKK
jgi:transmembrane sensor